MIKSFCKNLGTVLFNLLISIPLLLIVEIVTFILFSIVAVIVNICICFMQVLSDIGLYLSDRIDYLNFNLFLKWPNISSYLSALVIFFSTQANLTYLIH